ncbi:glycosyltransferase [Phenylobacterium sp.]|uniref:glycosyltransferase n=1 Tax=Phenylobacterium sp. TaxID=1871053 RepID=UPI0025F49862|nr:glycosyltransferase [Phenylobacterium sp.]
MRNDGPVVLFTGGLAGDGVARNTVHLANALARRGTRVEVICLKGGALAGELQGPIVTPLGQGRRPRGLALAAAVPALHARLQALSPSVVMSMGNHAHLAVWAALRGLPDIPRLYRISNDPRRSTRGASLRDLGLRLVAADATRLVCVSQAIAGQGAFRRARRDRRVEVLPNGVDAAKVQALARRGGPRCGQAPYIVAVGRAHPQKNYGALIDALALARRQMPDLQLRIVGAAPSRARGALVAQAQGLGIGSAVIFHGETANPFPWVAAAAAYVLPSLWEGASNSLLEALALGVPLVASRTAGNAAEVLDGGRYGALADPRDPADLARAIVRQALPETRILPGDRAAAFRLEAVTARLCGIVAGARSEHDEIQMLPEGPGHVRGLDDGLRGTNMEP